MAARVLLSYAARTLSRSTPIAAIRNARTFQSTARLMETPTAVLPVRKPVGAFRGGIFGFLLGATASGSALYYYVIEEYKVSNELLTEDIYTLQAAVQRIEGYVRDQEVRIAAAEKSR